MNKKTLFNLLLDTVSQMERAGETIIAVLKEEMQSMSRKDNHLRIIELVSKSGAGRLYTLKALVQLGEGWHGTGEVFTYIWRAFKYSKNHIYELTGKYPEVIELSSDKKFVRPSEGTSEVVVARINQWMKDARLQHHRPAA